MDGTILLGYCSPEDDSGLDYTQPTIIYENKHINLFEIESNTNYKRILSEILNKNSEKRPMLEIFYRNIPLPLRRMI